MTHEEQQHFTEMNRLAKNALDSGLEFRKKYWMLGLIPAGMAVLICVIAVAFGFPWLCLAAITMVPMIWESWKNGNNSFQHWLKLRQDVLDARDKSLRQ